MRALCRSRSNGRVVIDFIAHAGVLVNAVLGGLCLGICLLGVWTWRDPAAFWDQFNPFLKPYSRLTLTLGRVIGFLWAAGAVCGCLVVFGNALRAGINHHWI